MSDRDLIEPGGRNESRRGFYRPIPAGAPLGFVERVREAAMSPLSVRRRGDRRVPTLTPFLYVPATSTDVGVRPIPLAEALESGGVEVLDPSDNPVTTAASGTSYRIRCSVANAGLQACYAGIAQFYVATPADIERQVVRPAGMLPMLGEASFRLRAAASTLVSCPHAWTPATPDEAALASVVVHVFDPLIDPLLRRFDSLNDRHVARRDLMPNFAGNWEGYYELVGVVVPPFRVRLELSQQGTQVTVQAYMETQSGLPAVPQQTGTAVIEGRSVRLSVLEMLSGAPFTQNEWTLSLTGANLLHVEQHRAFIQPGDPRGDQDLHGDLPRA